MSGPAAPDRVAAFRADIAASPEALARLLDGVGQRRTSAVASRFVADRAGQLALRRPRRRRPGPGAAAAQAWVETAGGAAPTRASEELVAVVISASGRTAEAVAAAEAHRRARPRRRRHQRPRFAVGRSRPTSSCRCTPAWRRPASPGGRSGRPSPRSRCSTGVATRRTRCARRSTAWRPDWRPPEADLEAMADALDGAPSIDVLADASLLGVAEQAALMLREAPRLPAHAFETGDWLHTGVYLALPGHRVVLLEGSPADDEVVRTVERRAGRGRAHPGRQRGRPDRARPSSTRWWPSDSPATLWARTRAERPRLSPGSRPARPGPRRGARWSRGRTGRGRPKMTSADADPAVAVEIGGDDLRRTRRRVSPRSVPSAADPADQPVTSARSPAQAASAAAACRG